MTNNHAAGCICIMCEGDANKITRLTREVERLRELLDKHGINYEPATEISSKDSATE
jgi:hypothetical protein